MVLLKMNLRLCPTDAMGLSHHPGIGKHRALGRAPDKPLACRALMAELSKPRPSFIMTTNEAPVFPARPPSLFSTC